MEFIVGLLVLTNIATAVLLFIKNKEVLVRRQQVTDLREEKDQRTDDFRDHMINELRVKIDNLETSKHNQLADKDKTIDLLQKRAENFREKIVAIQLELRGMDELEPMLNEEGVLIQPSKEEYIARIKHYAQIR